MIHRIERPKKVEKFKILGAEFNWKILVGILIMAVLIFILWKVMNRASPGASLTNTEANLS